MSNYIKIPLASNPSRSFKTGITVDSATLVAANPTYAGNITSGTASDGGGATTVVPNIGSGATFTGVATGTTLSTLTLTIDALGANYLPGDVVTVAAGTTSSNQTSWDAPLEYTITAAMLADLDPLAGKSQIIPIDDIISVESVSNSSGLVDNKLFISTKVASGDTATSNSHIEFAGWTLDFEDLTYRQPNCIASISEAIAKAASAVNSQPEVVWFGGAEVTGIAYGKNPTTV